jgi:hypothetical protein
VYAQRVVARRPVCGSSSVTVQVDPGSRTRSACGCDRCPRGGTVAPRRHADRTSHDTAATIMFLDRSPSQPLPGSAPASRHVRARRHAADPRVWGRRQQEQEVRWQTACWREALCATPQDTGELLAQGEAPWLPARLLVLRRLAPSWCCLNSHAQACTASNSD